MTTQLLQWCHRDASESESAGAVTGGSSSLFKFKLEHSLSEASVAPPAPGEPICKLVLYNKTYNL